MKILNSIRDGVISVYDKTHWFTDKEAWWMFRLFAILEAVGWTLLGSAIIYHSFGWPWGDSLVTICGRIHGIFFICYFAFTLATARSMKWGLWRVLSALIVGIAPYASLVFEQIMAYDRRKRPIFVEPPADIDE